MVEKSEKFKETQKIMGLKQSSYVLGWVMTNMLKGVIACIIYLGVGVAANGFESANCSFGWVCLAYFLYFTSSFAETYMFSTFFSDISVGTDVTFLVQIISCFLYALSYISAIGSSNTALILLSILPQFALQTGMLSEGWNHVNQPGIVPKKINFNIQQASLMMGITTVVFFLLYLYFDVTLPNEYGTQKQHFWFLRKKKQSKLLNNENQKNEISQFFNSNNNESEINKPMLNINNTVISLSELDQSSAKYHEKIASQQNLQPTVIIKNLVKTFGKLNAVNDLSLSLYENQIFCLLGHNGSGKTTSISLLTGLIEKTQGKIQIYNQDIDNDLDDIRGKIGLCNQKDVVYDDLTVEEHLEFIGQVKGKTKLEVLEDIENIIPKCSLTKDRKKFAGQLSGGNKRKLCLAMALIGNSKVIFLDEPSSGMDPVSRREIWDILEDMKNDNRTVLLTTHFLDEAEFLASRIGIMQKGQLLTVGRPDFIKKQFGVGYYLQIYPKIHKEEEDKQQNSQEKNQNVDFTDKPQLSEEKIKEITDLVLKTIPQVKINPQSSKGTLVFTLPFDQKQYFVNLFQQLEKDEKISINMEINSLEDTFVNIGMEEEEEEAQQEQNKVRYAEFSDIQVPDCVINGSPSYTFWAQFKTLFLRKYKLTFRSISILFSFLLPAIMQLMGVIMARYVATGGQFAQFADFWQIAFMSNYQILSYCCLANSQGGSLALERQFKIKYALSVMGMRTLPYYLSTFIFDYIVYVLNIVAYLGFCYAFSVHVITNKIWEVLVIFTFAGVSITWGNYLVQYIFKSGRSAQKLQFWFNYIVLFAILTIFTLIDSQLLQQIIACLTPYTTLFNAFLQSVSKDEIPPYLQAFTNVLFKNEWAYYIIFSVQSIICIIATLYLNNENFNKKGCFQKKQQKIVDNENQTTNQQKDASVLQEENRILNQNCEDTIQLKKMQKIYENGFMAIKDSTFAVNKGEIFGLLGPNGSGKSTTFNILTSLIPKTSGSVKLNGIEVNQGEMEIYQNVGITPQFDPIWDILTVREHLTIYGGLKGLTGQNLEDSINYYIEVMQLNSYENVQAGVLSGGNKRKLCVTMALIGGPSMQFFDEPSTGLDPIARRFLWNTLKHSLQLRNSAIILTTHSMLEAETLCDKLGILINGQFKCIGSPSQLKKQYGEGYNIQIILDQHFKIKDKNLIIKDVLDKFPTSKLMSSLEETDGNLMFTVKYQNFSFYEVYKFLLQNKYSTIIKDFGISQSSLEQVFIYFSHFQKNQEPK